MDLVQDLVFWSMVRDLEHHKAKIASKSKMASPPTPSGASVCLLEYFVEEYCLLSIL